MGLGGIMGIGIALALRGNYSKARAGRQVLGKRLPPHIRYPPRAAMNARAASRKAWSARRDAIASSAMRLPAA